MTGEGDDEIQALAVAYAMAIVQHKRNLQARRRAERPAILVALTAAGEWNDGDDVPAG